MTQQRILVTGASGFTGASLVADLAMQGHQVVCMGRKPASGHSGVSHVSANLAEPGSLTAALAMLKSQPRFDSIIHLAVSRHHREFPDKALDLFYVNSASAAELLDFARVTRVSRLVFGSTGTVYSATTASTDDSGAGNHESEFRNPSSYFAASKLFADTLCQFYRSYFPVSVLRFYAPYGPGLEDRMLTDILNRVETGRPLSLPAQGPGLAFAATYIDDAKTVIHRALAQDWNETVNVAAPEVWTVESVGQMIGELVGSAPLHERTTAAFAPRIVPDLARLKVLMPDHAFTGLKDGLGRMIAARQ